MKLQRESKMTTLSTVDLLQRIVIIKISVE